MIFGFEHVFVGEWKDNKVGGQHSWVKYYLLEKANKIDYHGYIIHDLVSSTSYYTFEFVFRII